MPIGTKSLVVTLHAMTFDERKHDDGCGARVACVASMTVCMTEAGRGMAVDDDAGRQAARHGKTPPRLLDGREKQLGNIFSNEFQTWIEERVPRGGFVEEERLRSP